MLKIFFDTEFTELTQNAKLLSIALVAESGEQFYGECSRLMIPKILNLGVKYEQTNLKTTIYE